MTRKSWWRPLVGACLWVTVASPAAADEADDRAKEGRALLAAGKVAEACDKLAESQRLRPQGATLYDLGLCHEKQGKIATAWSELIDAAAAARKERNNDREGRATQKSRALEPRLPQLTVVAPSPEVPGLEVAIDGAPLDASSLGKPVPADPGERVVTAKAPGKKPFRGTVTLKERQKGSLTIGPLEDEAPPPPVAAAAPTAAAPPPPAPPRKEPEVRGPDLPDRFVFELGGLVGVAYGKGDTGTLPGVESLSYTFSTASGDYIQVCGASNCTATFDASAALWLGGQLFGGWAVTKDIHVGGRLFGGPRLGGGFLLAGGPSVSARVLPGAMKDLFVGGTLLLGGAEQTAQLAAVRGVGPRGLSTTRGERDVPVALQSGTAREGTVATEVAFGGALEVAYPIALGTTLHGTWFASAWPMAMFGSNGYALALPIGLSYRLH